MKLGWWSLTSLVLSSRSSSQIIERASAPWVPSSLSPVSPNNLSLIPPTLSRSPWPEEFPLNLYWDIRRFGHGLAQSLSDVASVRASIVDPGRLYTLQGQLIVFNVAWDNFVQKWPQYAPATRNWRPLPNRAIDRVLTLTFVGQNALGEHPKNLYLWWLCREVAREMKSVYLYHGPKTTRVQISVDWHDGFMTSLGVLRFDLEIPPSVVRVHYWPASVDDLPRKQGIIDENREATYLLLLHPRTELPWFPKRYWFNMDPIRMMNAADMLREAERDMLETSRQRSRDTVDVGGFSKTTPFAAYYLRVHGTHQGQTSVVWRKLLAVRVWASLADLIGAHGLVIGVFEVYDAGLPVGYVELGEVAGPRS